MKVQLLDEAERDLIDGFGFYEQQDEGLGDYFLDSVLADVASLENQAGMHAVHFGFHRFLTKRFPFAVYYSVASDLVQVHAILDCRRDPAWIRDRLT